MFQQSKILRASLLSQALRNTFKDRMCKTLSRDQKSHSPGWRRSPSLSCRAQELSWPCGPFLLHGGVGIWIRTRREIQWFGFGYTKYLFHPQMTFLSFNLKWFLLPKLSVQTQSWVLSSYQSQAGGPAKSCRYIFLTPTTTLPPSSAQITKMFCQPRWQQGPSLNFVLC